MKSILNMGMWLAVAVTFLIAALASPVFGQASPGGPGRNCSNATLHGDYGYSAEGVLIGTPGLPAEAQFRSVGMALFDGKETLTWVEHTILNGFPLNAQNADWTEASGTYMVKPDCTGTATVNTPNSPVPLKFFFVVVNTGKEIRTLLSTDAIAAIFTRVE